MLSLAPFLFATMAYVLISAPAVTAQEQKVQDRKTPRISLVPIAPGEAEPLNEENAEARARAKDPEVIAAGEQLFQAFNCVGCHFNGGGGMGPPLMDNKWIFGSEIEHIAASIREGRPAGMPAFRTLAPEEQIWQLSAYVKSLERTASKQGDTSATATSNASQTSGGGPDKGSNP